MLPLTRILGLAAVSALLALTAACIPAQAEDSALRSVGRHEHPVAECHLLKRAISRRVCQARLSREMKIDTAENK